MVKSYLYLVEEYIPFSFYYWIDKTRLISQSTVSYLGLYCMVCMKEQAQSTFLVENVGTLRLMSKFGVL